MKRKLAALCLASVMALALGSVHATAALGAEFRTNLIPVTLTGTQGKKAFQWSLTGGNVSCTSVSLKGEMKTFTTKQITLIPTYSGCTAFGSPNVVIDFNGCDYLYTSIGEVHITCSAGKVIEITVPKCTVKIGPQTMKGVTYFNNPGETDFTISNGVVGFTYEECGKGPDNNSTWTGETTVTGSSGGTPIDVWYQ